MEVFENSYSPKSGKKITVQMLKCVPDVTKTYANCVQNASESLT